MPTYQYACTACDHAFEAVQSFKGEIRKVYSSVGVVFKGSGFYKTDSAKPAPTTSSE
jgi:predicted nucleic acid-binding Zn ribbon protein